MLKEAIEKIQTMTQPQIFNYEGHAYAIDRDGFYNEIRPELVVPESLEVNSLDALVNLIKKEACLYEYLFVSVSAYNQVRVFTEPLPEYRWDRWLLYTARTTDVPGWEAEVTSGFDEATVALLTRFQEGGDREYCIQLLSQITTGAHVTYTDNGIASTMVMKKGAALAENVTIKPIVKLRPYRTFQEVEQPEGSFLIRVRERGITFIEADGGMWKLEARRIVKSWLEEQLKEIPDVKVML